MLFLASPSVFALNQEEFPPLSALTLAPQLKARSLDGCVLEKDEKEVKLEKFSKNKAKDIDESDTRLFPLPNMPSGIKGTIFSYLPVRDIIVLHKNFPSEISEIAYALSHTPSPILWNFHDPLYSLTRFCMLMPLISTRAGIHLKLSNVGDWDLILPYVGASATLDVSSNYLGPQGALTLTRQLPPRLIYLNASANFIENEGVVALLNAALNHDTIKTINIRWNHFQRNDGVSKLISALQARGVSVLSNLNLGGINFL